MGLAPHADRAGAEPLWPASELARMSVCDTPLRAYDAFGAVASGPARAPAVECAKAAAGVVASSHCTLIEDVPSKPGWVLRRDAGSAVAPSVSFEVVFGRWPTLNLVYLQSFAGTAFGDVDLCIVFKGARPCRPYTLRGQHGGNATSQNRAEFLTLFMGDHQSGEYGSAGMSGFRVPPFASGTVNLTLRSNNKFKLVSLHSC